MTTTTSNWLASTAEQVNTTTSDIEAKKIEYADTETVIANDMPNATTSLEGTEATAEPIAPNTEGAVHHPVVILNPNNDVEIPEVLPTLSLADIKDIFETKDYAQLHGHFDNESLVVLPKAQLEKLLVTMKDNMLLMNGLGTIAQVIQPLAEHSKEGKALTDFLVKNADIFSGKEISVVNGMRVLSDLPSVIRNGKELMKKIDFDILKDNAGFFDAFKDVLARNNNPFIKLFAALGNGIENVKTLNA